MIQVIAIAIIALHGLQGSVGSAREIQSGTHSSVRHGQTQKAFQTLSHDRTFVEVDTLIKTTFRVLTYKAAIT